MRNHPAAGDHGDRPEVPPDLFDAPPGASDVLAPTPGQPFGPDGPRFHADEPHSAPDDPPSTTDDRLFESDGGLFEAGDRLSAPDDRLFEAGDQLSGRYEPLFETDEPPLGSGEPPLGAGGPSHPGEPPFGPGGSPMGPGDPPEGGPPPGEPPIGPDGPPAGPGGPGVPGGPPAGPGGPPRAARSTTVALIVGLFVAILVTGVLGTIAVLMTRQPDLPLGAPPPRRLATSVHFAPVTGVRAAPCPGAEAVLDEAGTTCYQVAPGVTVVSAVKVATVADGNGGYAVRLVLAPEIRQRFADLTKDALNQQLAVVVDDKVVTAPRVAQAITEDTLSIAGLTKETADALVARLLGTAGPATGTSGPSPSPSTPAQSSSTCPPGASATGGTAPPGGSTPPPGTGTGNGTGTGTGTGNGTGNGTGTPPGTGNGTGTSPGTEVPGGTATCAPTTAAPTAGPTGGVPTGTASQPGSMPLVPQGTTHTPGTGGQASQESRGARSPETRATGSASRVKRTPDPRFASCKQAHAANYGPYTKGVHVEYGWYVDGDHDGVACERGDIT
jgi:hypothetical protein